MVLILFFCEDNRAFGPGMKIATLLESDFGSNDAEPLVVDFPDQAVKRFRRSWFRISIFELKASSKVSNHVRRTLSVSVPCRQEQTRRAPQDE